MPDSLLLVKYDTDGVLPFKETLGWKDFSSGLGPSDIDVEGQN